MLLDFSVTIGNNTSYYESFGSFILILGSIILMGALYVWLIYTVICRIFRKKIRGNSKPQKWIRTKATIVDTKTERTGKVVRMGSKYNVNSYDIYEPSVVTYVKIEYEVNGRKYKTWVNAKNFKNKTSGTIMIKYLEGHPRVREY